MPAPCAAPPARCCVSIYMLRFRSFSFFLPSFAMTVISLRFFRVRETERSKREIKNLQMNDGCWVCAFAGGYMHRAGRI